MTQPEPAEKRYPVRFPAPNPATAPALMPNGVPTNEGRILNTYVADWLSVREFEALMPGHDIVRYMCYESVGPDSWAIHIYPEEVLSCERDNAVQTLYVRETLKTFVGREPKDKEETVQMARGYGELSPDAMLFLLRLHEYLHPPQDDFTKRETLDQATLYGAVQLMLDHDTKLHDLIKYPHRSETHAPGNQTAPPRRQDQVPRQP